MWKFIQDEVLGMKWLNRLIGAMLSTFGLDIESRIGGSVQFFLYDCIKIMVLLGVLIFIISYIQSYFPPERSRRTSSPTSTPAASSGPRPGISCCPPGCF